MKKIKILGTGCPNCKRTAINVETAVEDLGLIDVDIEKVEDIMKIIEYNILSTPAIIINDEIKVKGRVPSVKELKELLA